MWQLQIGSIWQVFVPAHSMYRIRHIFIHDCKYAFINKVDSASRCSSRLRHRMHLKHFSFLAHMASQAPEAR